MNSETPTGLTRIVVRGTGLATAGLSLTRAISFAVYLVLARLAVPEDFGQFAAGGILVGVTAIFAHSGMLAALVQRRTRLEEAANTALVSTILGGLGFSLLALALAPVVGLLFGSRTIALVAAAISGSLFLRSFAVVPDALMQRRFSFVRRVIVEPSAALAFGAASIAATSKGMGVWGLVVGWYASDVVEVLLSWSLARWRPNLRLASFRMWRELVGFGRHVIAAELIRRTAAETQTILLGRYVSTSALGQYQYATRLADQPLGVLVNTVSYVLFPAFSRISLDEVRFRRAVLRALRWVSAVALPASLIFFPLGEPLVVVLFGERWRDAGNALMALCAYPAGMSFVSIASEVFKSAGRPGMLTRTNLVWAALSVPLMLALLKFGLIGVAAAISISSIGLGGYALYGISTVIQVPLRRVLADLGPQTVAAIAMAGALYPTERFVVDSDAHGTFLGVVLILAEAVLGAAIYLAILAVIAPAKVRELADGLRSARAGLTRRAAPTEAPLEPDGTVVFRSRR